MNIVTEHKISGEPIDNKAPSVRSGPVLWFIIVGACWPCSSAACLVQLLPRPDDQAVLRQQQAAAGAVSAAEAKSEVMPNLLTAVGGLAAVHQVNVTSDVNGRVTEIKFDAGPRMKAGTPLVQLFDGPEQGDLANYKAQATDGAALARPRQATGARASSARRQPSTRRRRRTTRPMAGIAKTEALISQKLVRAPFAGDLGVRKVEVGQYLTAGTPIVSLTDLSEL